MLKILFIEEERWYVKERLTIKKRTHILLFLFENLRTKICKYNSNMFFLSKVASNISLNHIIKLVV